MVNSGCWCSLRILAPLTRYSETHTRDRDLFRDRVQFAIDLIHGCLLTTSFFTHLVFSSRPSSRVQHQHQHLHLHPQQLPGPPKRHVPRYPDIDDDTLSLA